jgi:DNA-binding MarR family transcriptional regulator
MLNDLNDNFKMTHAYYKTIVMSEKLHRLFLDTLKHEINRMKIKDINNVQCLILYNMGDKEVNVGELTKGGYYLGSNVSYNLRKLVENGYLLQQPGRNDRRQSEISLTEKGRELSNQLHELLSLHAEELSNIFSVTAQNLDAIEQSFKSIESFLNGRSLKCIK